MSKQAKIVARGIDTLVVNGYYTDEQGNPVKQDLEETLQGNVATLKRGGNSRKWGNTDTMDLCRANLAHATQWGQSWTISLSAEMSVADAGGLTWQVEWHCTSTLLVGIPVGMSRLKCCARRGQHVIIRVLQCGYLPATLGYRFVCGCRGMG